MQAELQEKIDAATAGTWAVLVDIAMDALRCRRGGRCREAVGAARNAAWRSAGCCSAADMLLLADEPTTISTPNRWPGWSVTSASSPAPSWR